MLERTLTYIDKLPMPRDWTAHPGTRPYRLLIDATGCGRPVVELFRHEGVPAVAVTMGHGEQTVQHDWLQYTLPKKTLVGCLQVAMQSRRILVSNQLADATTLLKEMQNFQYRITKDANDQYGAWRSGQHDDLLFAVGLCVWFGEQHTGVRRQSSANAGFAAGAGNPLDRMGEREPPQPANPFTVFPVGGR
jgi:hypothetical protein